MAQWTHKCFALSISLCAHSVHKRYSVFAVIHLYGDLLANSIRNRNQTNDNTINLSLREKRFVAIYDFGICETPVRYLRHALDAFEDK